MSFRNLIPAVVILLAVRFQLAAQDPDSLFNMVGIVYDEQFFPVPATHVINLHSHLGDVTDSLGIFHLPVRLSDTLLIRNIAFRDTLVTVGNLSGQRHIMIKRRYYELQEARIFEWGSTYGDFREAIIEMPNQQNLGESMGLPRQDPDHIPYEMNEEALKSPAFLLSSPVSYFYHNFSRQARSARKVYWLEKNRTLHEAFEAVMGSDNISSITGLKGKELQDFMAFLYARMVCDFKCTELQLYTEIYGLWDVYKELGERQMLPSGNPRQ